MDLTERTLESRSIFEGKIVTLLVDQAEQVLAEALCCLGGPGGAARWETGVPGGGAPPGRSGGPAAG